MTNRFSAELVLSCPRENTIKQKCFNSSVQREQLRCREPWAVALFRKIINISAAFPEAQRKLGRDRKRFNRQASGRIVSFHEAESGPELWLSLMSIAGNR